MSVKKPRLSLPCVTSSRSVFSCTGLAAGATKELLSFPLVGKNNEREIYMIRSRDRRPTKSARAFIDFLLDRRTLH